MNSLTQARFQKAVQEELKNEKSLMQAILNVCEKFGVEPERCKKYIDEGMRSKLQAEAQSLNLIKKNSDTTEVE